MDARAVSFHAVVAGVGLMAQVLAASIVKMTLYGCAREARGSPDAAFRRPGSYLCGDAEDGMSSATAEEDMDRVRRILAD